MQFTIRDMTAEDIQQVQHVAKTSWNYTYEGIIPSGIQASFLNFAYSVEMLQRRISNSLMLIAEDDGKIIGFANFTPLKEKGTTELSAIYLDPEYHRKGIGTALLVKGINRLQAPKEIYVNVEKDNDLGRTFYEAKGFKVVSEFDDNFDGHILKTIRMALKL